MDDNDNQDAKQYVGDEESKNFIYENFTQSEILGKKPPFLHIPKYKI